MPKDEITRVSRAILSALSAEPNRWFYRKDIAQALGHDAINKWQIILLDRLVASGMIEHTTTSFPNSPLPVHQYKARTNVS